MFTIFSSPPPDPLPLVHYQTATPLGTMKMAVANGPDGQTLVSTGFIGVKEGSGDEAGELAGTTFGALLKSLPCHLPGTPFQVAVWKQLGTLLPAQTVTYAELAHALRRPKAYRAVGGAVARNPIAVRIPCHRVVPGGGGTGGFRWGSWRKQALLDAEKQGTSPFDFLFGAVTVKG